MNERVQVRPGTYYDSVTLMQVSEQAKALPGVVEAAVVAGTPVNLELIERQGFGLKDQQAGPNDLVIAVRAEDERGLEEAFAGIDRLLVASTRGSTGEGRAEAEPRSITNAARRDPALNMVVLSIPGRHLAYEIASALQAGLSVFCFSDGLGKAEEAAFKRIAVDRGLLLMGPDCGTSIIDGVALGFANVVARGPVGIVGASGTGMQEVICLLDAAGVGISQAIGVGGRDLSAAVGGTMTVHALDLLGAESQTESIVVVSKPPDATVAQVVAEAASRTGKPAVLCLLGLVDQPELPQGVELVRTLADAVRWAAERHGRHLPAEDGQPPRRPTPGVIRGLFCGGTLCSEAMGIVSRVVGKVASNIPLRPEWRLTDVDVSEGHTFVDFGEDELTEGRAHPMIDPSLRDERFEREAADPEVGVLLLDVVLGYGAHDDPAADLAARISRALRSRPDDLTVVISLCGAEGDPQGLHAQAAALRTAGALVTRSSARAARLALASAGLDLDEEDDRG